MPSLTKLRQIHLNLMPQLIKLQLQHLKNELATLIKEANELVKDGLDENTVALLKSHTQVGQGVVDDKDAKAETIAENIKLIKAAMTKLGWTESTTTSDTTKATDTTKDSTDTATTTDTSIKQGRQGCRRD